MRPTPDQEPASPGRTGRRLVEPWLLEPWLVEPRPDGAEQGAQPVELGRLAPQPRELVLERGGPGALVACGPLQDGAPVDELATLRGRLVGAPRLALRPGVCLVESIPQGVEPPGAGRDGGLQASLGGRGRARRLPGGLRIGGEFRVRRGRLGGESPGGAGRLGGLPLAGVALGGQRALRGVQARDGALELARKSLFAQLAFGQGSLESGVGPCRRLGSGPGGLERALGRLRALPPLGQLAAERLELAEGAFALERDVGLGRLRPHGPLGGRGHSGVADRGVPGDGLVGGLGGFCAEQGVGGRHGTGEGGGRGAGLGGVAGQQALAEDGGAVAGERRHAAASAERAAQLPQGRVSPETRGLGDEHRVDLLARHAGTAAGRRRGARLPRRRGRGIGGEGGGSHTSRPIDVPRRRSVGRRDAGSRADSTRPLVRPHPLPDVPLRWP